MADAGLCWILYRRTECGRVPVADLDRRGDEWSITLRDTPYKEAAAHALSLVSLYQLRRGVEPHEGDLYLQALRQTFANSSRWGVAPADAVGHEALEPPP
jgi:hypothetical protein